VDLLSADFDIDKDDATLLNDILNTPATASGTEFSSEWHAAFGSAGPPLMTAGTTTPSDADSNVADFFMPSTLLDMTAGNVCWVISVCVYYIGALFCTFVITYRMFTLAQLSTLSP